MENSWGIWLGGQLQREMQRPAITTEATKQNGLCKKLVPNCSPGNTVPDIGIFTALSMWPPLSPVMVYETEREKHYHKGTSKQQMISCQQRKPLELEWGEYPARYIVSSGCQWVVKAVWTVRPMSSGKGNHRVEPVFGKSLGRTGLEESQVPKWLTLQEGEWNCSDWERRVETTNQKPKNRETLSFLPVFHPVRLEGGKAM